MTERQRYTECMEWREINQFYKQAQGMPRWDKNWRTTVDKMFDSSTGRMVPGYFKKHVIYGEATPLVRA